MNGRETLEWLQSQEVLANDNQRLELVSMYIGNYDSSRRETFFVNVQIIDGKLDVNGVDLNATFGNDMVVEATYRPINGVFTGLKSIRGSLDAQYFYETSVDVRVAMNAPPDLVVASFPADDSVALQSLMRDTTMGNVLTNLPNDPGLYFVSFFHVEEYSIFVNTSQYTHDIEALLDNALSGYKKKYMKSNHVVYYMERKEAGEIVGPDLHVHTGDSLARFINNMDIDMDQVYWDLSLENYYAPVSIGGYRAHFWPKVYSDHAKLLQACKRMVNYSSFADIELTSFDILFLWRCLFSNRTIEPVIQWNRLLGSSTSLPRFLLTLDSDIENPTLSDVYVYPSYEPSVAIWRVKWQESMRDTAMKILPIGRRRRETKTADSMPLSLIPRPLDNNFEFDGEATLTPTCMDIVMGEEQEILAFLEESTNHMVFVFPTSTAGGYVACYDREYLDNASVFYECLWPNSVRLGMSVQYDSPIYRLDVRDYPVYIDEDNFLFLKQFKEQMFMVEPNVRSFKATISREAIQTNNYVSADHCQDGTQKSLSIIRAMV